MYISSSCKLVLIIPLLSICRSRSFAWIWPAHVTRLWNDIIRTLRTGLPLRKQKKGLRTYEECIGSAELVEWLHKSLQKNVNFGPDVTRDQTVQLLKKLYRCGKSLNILLLSWRFIKFFKVIVKCMPLHLGPVCWKVWSKKMRMANLKRPASFTGDFQKLFLNWILYQQFGQACHEKSCKERTQPCQESAGRCQHQHS